MRSAKRYWRNGERWILRALFVGTSLVLGILGGHSPWVESSLADPFPSDAETSVAQALRVVSDTDFLNVYVGLSDAEKTELSGIQASELATWQLGAGLSRFAQELNAANSELLAWAQAPVKSGKETEAAPLAWLRVVQESPRKYTVVLAKGLCAGPKTSTLPSRSDPKMLAKKDAFAKAPTDADRACERQIVVKLQGDWGTSVKEDEMQSIPAKRFGDFMKSADWPALFKRIWISAERWEVEEAKSINFAQRLRVIEVLAGAFDEARFAKRKDLIAYLKSLEARGTRNVDSCALLGQFYLNASLRPTDAEAGLCARSVKLPGFKVVRLPATVDLPGISAGLTPQAVEKFAYPETLRAAYLTALRATLAREGLGTKEFFELVAQISHQIEYLQFSDLAGKLFAEFRRQSGDFDFEGECARLLRKDPAFLNRGPGEIDYERKALEVSLENLKHLELAVGESGAADLRTHRKIVEALLKRLNFL